MHRLDDLVLVADVAIDQATSLHQHVLAMCFVDLAKAFDSVPRARLFVVLREHYGIDVSLIETIRQMYTNAVGRVVGDSVDFPMNAGVK